MEWNSGGKLTYDSSDRRQKSLIEDCPFGLNAVMKMKPRQFLYKGAEFEGEKMVFTDDGMLTIGFVAQELYETLPEAVFKPQDDVSALWSVKIKRIVPVLVRAIQQQQEQIEDLKRVLDEATKSPTI